MKKLLCLFVFSVTVGLAGSEIIFVPGWLSKPTAKTAFIAADYSKTLSKIYPGHKISVLYWESNTTFDQALVNAANFSVSVANSIAAKKSSLQKEIILIGHSLGARIILDAVGILAQRNIKIKQIILLGAAIDYDASTAAVNQVTTEKNINIFSKNDSILKYLYANHRKKMAMGFCGIENTPASFVQYKFTTSEITIANTDISTAMIESANHMALKYLTCLQQAINQQINPYTPEFDYSKVQLNRTALAIPYNWSIPPVFSMQVIDSYADWSLASANVVIDITKFRKNYKINKTIYFIIDHHGKIAMWNFLLLPLQNEFNIIKSQIVPLK